jgi:hypothetical protein
MSNLFVNDLADIEVVTRVQVWRARNIRPVIHLQMSKAKDKIYFKK